MKEENNISQFNLVKKIIINIISRPAYFRQGKCYSTKSKRNTGTGNYYYMGN